MKSTQSVMSAQDLELVRDSVESNPTVYSVFMSGTLHQMNNSETIVYLSIVILSSAFNCICLFVVARSTTFHSNLQVPMWWTLFSYFELAISKIMTVLFQNVYLTEDNVATGGLPIIPWIAFTHYHFIFNVMAAPIIVVVERGLATKYLFDYEKKKRRWILLSILSFQIIFGFLFTYLTTVNVLRYVPAGILAASIALVSFVMFCHINRVNNETLKFVETKNRDIKFDLSVRYQLRENCRTFKMLKRLFVTLIVLIVVMAAFKTLPMITDLAESTKYTFREITDMIVHAGPIYITITLLWAVEDYRMVLFRLLGHEKRRIFPSDNLKKDEKDIYFEQFLLTIQ